MGIGRTGRAVALAALAAILLAGCAENVRTHGYAPDEASLAELKPGADTRATVAAKIGRPSTAGLMQGGDWFYVESRWRDFGARAPREVSREVVVVSFDAEGVLRDSARYGLEDGRVVPISRRTTETTIRNVSLIQQLLRNVGNIRADQLVD